MIPTVDPNVVIEEKRFGYVRYRCLNDGRRWEIYGVCDRRGLCLIGSVVNGIQIRDLNHLNEITKQLGKDRIDSELDVPVTPEFSGCCPLQGKWL